jgi:hypothetical protein
MPIAADIPAAELAIVEMTNAFRKKHNLATVRPHPKLVAAARAYAQVLAEGNELSHTLRESTPATRVQRSGYSYCQIAENLSLAKYSDGFSAQDFARRTMRGWERSPGHLRNLMLPHLTDIGVAVVRASPGDQRYIAVQLFGRPYTQRYAFKVQNVGSKSVAYEFGGKRYDLEREQYMTHTPCMPGTIDIISRDKDKAAVRYEARDGQVYSLIAGPGGVVVDVAPDPRRPGAPSPAD